MSKGRVVNQKRVRIGVRRKRKGQKERSYRGAGRVGAVFNRQRRKKRRGGRRQGWVRARELKGQS